MGPIKEILAESQFQEEVTTSSQAKLVVVDFTASWCGPCQTIAPFYEQLSRKYPNAVFLKVDVDKCQETAVNQRVSVMPTFHFYRNRVKIDSFQGADPQRLEGMILKYYDEGTGENDVGVAGHKKEGEELKKEAAEPLKVSSSAKNLQAKSLKITSSSKLTTPSTQAVGKSSPVDNRASSAQKAPLGLISCPIPSNDPACTNLHARNVGSSTTVSNATNVFKESSYDKLKTVPVALQKTDNCVSLNASEKDVEKNGVVDNLNVFSKTAAASATWEAASTDKRSITPSSKGNSAENSSKPLADTNSPSKPSSPPK